MERGIHGSPHFPQNMTDTVQKGNGHPQLNASNAGIASTANNGMLRQCR